MRACCCWRRTWSCWGLRTCCWRICCICCGVITWGVIIATENGTYTETQTWAENVTTAEVICTFQQFWFYATPKMRRAKGFKLISVFTLTSPTCPVKPSQPHPMWHASAGVSLRALHSLKAKSAVPDDVKDCLKKCCSGLITLAHTIRHVRRFH